MTPTPPTSPIADRPRRPSSSAWPRAALVLASVFAAALASQLVLSGAASAVVAALLVSAVWFVARTCAERAREARTSRVIAYVAQATRLALPLPDFCRVAALSETPGTRQALERLAAFTAASLSIGDALAAAMPEMSPRAVGLARVGEANGTLPETFARLAAIRAPTPGASALIDASADDNGFNRPTPQLMYFAVLLVAIAAVCLILSVFVVPKFAQIFHDFRVPTPPWLRVAMTGTLAGIDLRTELLLVMVLVTATVIYSIVSRGSRLVRQSRATPPFRSRGDARRRWPIVDAWRDDRDRADVCQAVADALAARRPADAAIGEAAMLDVAPALAARAALWQTFVANGQPLGVAARAAGMPTLIGTLAGDRSSDPTDAFAFLARHYRGRSERAHEWLRAMASPLLTIIAAVPIGLIAYGLFDCIRLLIVAATPRNLGM